MKATVIKFFDAQGNEVKNVSTEIELNGELYVKKGADKHTDYSHLVGKWVKRLEKTNSIYTKDKWYKVIKDTEYPIAIKDNLGGDSCCNMSSEGRYAFLSRFDLTNPLPYNPDTVVGLKELPNDGKVYAECVEDVIIDGNLRSIKGLFYFLDKNIITSENHTGFDSFPIKGYTDFTSHFRIHTLTPEPIWKTCREGMWEYDNEMVIYTDRYAPEQDESLRQSTRFLNAFAYLSEVARRCNGDRVVDWDNGEQIKYTFRRRRNELETIFCDTYHREIAFLDEQARDHSFEVDKHIWNDYYGLPNE
jgi:hypothetical protein